MKVPQIDPVKQLPTNKLLISKPTFLYSGIEFNRIADFRLKVGYTTEGGLPILKEPIKGMTLDQDLDTSQVKKFFKVKSKKTWTFAPEVGDEGTYNMTLYITLNMAGQPIHKIPYESLVIVWNDPPAKG